MGDAKDVGTSQSDPRLLVWVAAGIRPEERRNDKLAGAFDDLKASSLAGGPFNVALTSKASEHLTFRELNGRSTILILNSETTFRFLIPKLLGIAS